MKNSISSITLLLISLLGVSCVGNKKTGVSVYQDKGQPYETPMPPLMIFIISQ